MAEQKKPISGFWVLLVFGSLLVFVILLGFLM
jgi:hypothetical protein